MSDRHHRPPVRWSLPRTYVLRQDALAERRYKSKAKNKSCPRRLVETLLFVRGEMVEGGWAPWRASPAFRVTGANGLYEYVGGAVSVPSWPNAVRLASQYRAWVEASVFEPFVMRVYPATFEETCSECGGVLQVGDEKWWGHFGGVWSYRCMGCVRGHVRAWEAGLRAVVEERVGAVRGAFGVEAAEK